MSEIFTDNPAEYPRMLSRCVTYLHRQKIKYMNDHLKKFNLHGCMYTIVSFCARNPGTSQDAIVSFMNIDKCTIARRTKRLEELGYIRRETDANDRRQNNLYLTPKGEGIVPEIRKHLENWSRSIQTELSDDEERTLVTLLDKVVDTCSKIKD